MITKKNDAKCLVVSQLKDTWDLNAELIFINDSVVDFCCLDELKAINHLVLENQWDSLKYEVESVNFVENKVSRYRRELAVILNDIHNVRHEESYWKIILDAWLISFLSVALDRYNKVVFAQSLYPSAVIKESNSTINLPPKDAWQFALDFQTDEFNQYVYVEAARIVGMQTIGVVGKSECGVNQANKSNRNTTVKWAIKKILTIFLKVRNPTLILDSYFKPEDIIQIFLKSWGKVLMIPSRLLLEGDARSNEKGFDRELLCVEELDRFDGFVNVLLKKCFPKSFLEDFSAILYCNNQWLKYVSVLGTATCIRSSDAYKIAAAELAKRGGRLLGFQHGGASNCFGVGRFEYIETEYVSRYYGWGEGGGNFGMGAAKLRRINKNVNRLLCDKILFVSTGHPRNTIWTNVRENANCFINYLEEQHDFYRNLSEETKYQFVCRPYMQDYGWRYKERWHSEFGNEVLFDQNERLYDSFQVARIFISDHISTTWLEALYSGLPVLMYIDIRRLALLPEVESLFLELVEVGVIHHTPKSAAKFVSDIYGNVDEWWASNKTKRVVKKLERYFITESDEFISGWSKELIFYHNEK